MPTCSSISIARCFGLAARQLLVDAHCFGDLVSDRERGIQARHRLLEDHRDLAAADRAHLASSSVWQIATAN